MNSILDIINRFIANCEMLVRKDEPHEHRPAVQQAQLIQRRPFRRRIRAIIQQIIVTARYRPLHQTVFFQQMLVELKSESQKTIVHRHRSMEVTVTAVIVEVPRM